MNPTKLNDRLQIIGIFGVIASLMFVGLQLKQSHEIAVSAAYQARADTSVAMSMTAANTPEFTSGTSKLYKAEFEDITAQEFVALEYNFGAIMTLYENQHQQYELGFLPEEHWAKNVVEIRCMVAQPLFRNLAKVWAFRASFEAIIDELIAEVTADPGDCRVLEPFDYESLFELR